MHENTKHRLRTRLHFWQWSRNVAVIAQGIRIFEACKKKEEVKKQPKEYRNVTRILRLLRIHRKLNTMGMSKSYTKT